MADAFAKLFYSYPVIAVLAGLTLFAILYLAERGGRYPFMLNMPKWRMMSGYAGAFIALVLYVIGAALVSGIDMVRLGQLPADGLGVWVGDRAVYLFALLAPTACFLIFTIGFVLFALLARIGHRSVSGVVLAAFFFSLWASVYGVQSSPDARCSASFVNKVSCLASMFVDVCIPAVMIALGFALGARLPVFKTVPVK